MPPVMQAAMQVALQGEIRFWVSFSLTRGDFGERGRGRKRRISRLRVEGEGEGEGKTLRRDVLILPLLQLLALLC